MEQLKLNMIPSGVNPVFHASQYDKGRQIRFVLDETLSGAEVTVSYRAKDGTEHGNVQTSVSGNTITDTIPEEVLTDYGMIEGEVNIDGIGSLNFFVEVEKDAYDGGVITTQTASGPIATFSTNMVEAFKSLKSDINPVQDLHGYSKPWSGGAGKNKFNDTTGTHTINANTETTITIGDVYLEANTTYTISCKQTPAPLTSFVRNTLSVVGGGTTTYNPAGNDYTIKPMVFTPTVSGTYSIRVWGHTLSANTTYSQFQVEVGSTATAYEPYSNICPISGFNALSVTRTGVNLWDEQWELGTLSANGTPSPSNINIRSKNFIKVMPSATLFIKSPYTAGIGIYQYDSNHNYITRSFIADNTITLSSNTHYLKFRTPDNVTTYGNNISINYPSNTEYHAYNGQTATVNFGQTVYGGVCDVANGKVTITHGIVDLGTLDWSAAGNMWYASLSGVKPIFDTTVPNAICTQYKAVSWVSGTSGTEEGVFCFLPAYNQLRVRDTSYSSASDFKTAMSGVMLVYELATPNEITTTPENLMAIVGQNNVYHDCNGDTEVEYYIEV